jgi:hypothetical protein
VSDNELIERKQQPTQSVGLITDTTTPLKVFTCDWGTSDKSYVDKWMLPITADD